MWEDRRHRIPSADFLATAFRFREGEAPAEPDALGRARLLPSRTSLGGRGSCRAGRLGRARLPPSRTPLGGRGSCRAAGENQRVLLCFFCVGLFHHGKTRNTRKKEGVTVALFADAGLGKARLVARRGIQGRGWGSAQRELRPPKNPGKDHKEPRDQANWQRVRLSRSFALPRIRLPQQNAQVTPANCQLNTDH